MTEGEKRAWLAFLRQPWPPGPPNREGLLELSEILERQWFPPRRGRRSSEDRTSWQVANFNLRSWGLRKEVRREQEAAKRRGEKGRRDLAEEAVAERRGITRRALQEQMRFTKRKSTI
jgi:hypothetical protein